MRGPVEIAPGIHGLGSEMVNWYLVEEDGRLCAVDAGLARFRDTLVADLQAIGQQPGDVDAVVLTHSDSDHTGLVPALREAGARVVIHRADEATLRKPRPKSGDGTPIHVMAMLRHPGFWRFVGHLMRGGKPVRVEGAETFEGDAVLDVPGSPRAIHTPGHSDGHCVLHFERHGALFVGDALCTWNPLDGSRVPQVMPKAMNVSYETCFASLAAIERLEADVTLPGHGDPWREGPADAVARARERRR